MRIATNSDASANLRNYGGYVRNFFTLSLYPSPEALTTRGGPLDHMAHDLMFTTEHCPFQRPLSFVASQPTCPPTK